MTLLIIVFFFFNDTATTEIYTLSLHDALPICRYTEHDAHLASTDPLNFTDTKSYRDRLKQAEKSTGLKRSEEHTSELQSLAYLVCRLLLEKKKKEKAKLHIYYRVSILRRQRVV